MKELSIEEKAKRYDEALERAKYYHDRDNIQFLENIFPELAESEDEKMRKELISLVKETKVTERYYDLSKMLAWLEKQGEQKPADKVEPKFKNEQWITIKKNEYGKLESISSRS